MEVEWFDLPHELFKGTEELFCISLVSRALDPIVNGDIWTEQMSNLKKMFWIFQPEAFDPSRNYKSISNCFAGHDYRDDLIQLAIDLSKTRLVIVNSGIIQLYDKDCRKTTVEESQRQTEIFVKRELAKDIALFRNWSPERTKERLESIEFMNLDDFMEKEEWWKYLNADELEEWKAMVDDVEKRFVVKAETDPADGKEVMND
ncbi:uncharacterized protein L199_007464 [Kwoniella botswanensis]|uniref:uncharacterized protein n=1 Tax=Kwoniella botswanensis TaxID=1268659 RepID=UPI00315CF248